MCHDIPAVLMHVLLDRYTLTTSIISNKSPSSVANEVAARIAHIEFMERIV